MSLKIVVIGTGFGRHTVAPAFESLGCDVDLVSPRDARAVREAVAAPCDLVSIHSPPFLHCEHVRLAVGHGRSVLCDKPFGCNATEAREMLELASASGVMHFLNFEFRCDPLRAKMKELLDAGAIGKPHHLSSSMFMSRGRKAPHGWLFEKDKGGGWIGAFASHHVDLLHWLFGEIETVSCLPRIDVVARPGRGDAGGQLHDATAEDALTAWFRLKNGVTASIDTACSAAVNLPAQIVLFGSEGVLQLSHNAELVLMRPEQDPERFPVARDENPLGAAQERWLAKVCEAVKTRRQIAPDFTTGLACAGILDAMRTGGSITSPR